MEPCRTIIIT